MNGLQKRTAVFLFCFFAFVCLRAFNKMDARDKITKGGLVMRYLFTNALKTRVEKNEV
jgi:hypothetical protein